MEFCQDRFWVILVFDFNTWGSLELNVTWNTNQPKLTQCLAQVGFIFLPNLLFWFFVPFEIVYILRSKNRRISYNFFNTSRLLLCALGLLLNAYQIGLEFYAAVIKDNNQTDRPTNHYVLSDFLAASSKSISFLILFILFFLHRLNGLITSGIIWTFLLFNTFCASILMADVYLFNESNYHPKEVYIIIFNFGLNALLFIFSSFTDDAVEAGLKENENEVHNQKQEDRLYKDVLNEANLNSKQSPESYSSFPNKLFFSWFTDVLWFSRNGNLKAENLCNLEDRNKIDNILSDFNREFYKELERLKKAKKNSSKKVHLSSLDLVKVFFKSYGLYFIGGAFAKLVHDLILFMNPKLLELLILFIKDSESQFVWHGGLLVLLMLFAGVAGSLMINVHFERMFSIGMRLKCNIINLVYIKSFKLSSIAKRTCCSGETVNLISVDANRFIDVLIYINYLWSAPFQIIFGIYLLYQQLGPSIFVGVAFLLAVMPISSYLINIQNKIQQKQMKHKDERVKLMNEILSGIKVLKLYSWETKFMDNVSSVRKKEINFIKKSSLINVASNFFYMFATVMVSLATFAVYVFSSKENVLTPEKCFVSITLFTILQYPIELLPALVNFFIRASVSLKRISKFLNADELVEYVNHDFDKENAVSVEGKALFAWDLETNEKDKKKKEMPKRNGVSKNDEEINDDPKSDKKKTFALQDIEFNVKKGSFTAIIGQVGSGKTSLLCALLGEMQLREDKMKSKCKINISEDQIISYGGQIPFIQNCTLRDNILFGKQFDSEKYSEIIKACSLEPDLKILPGKDLVEIGEKGINLSGGQKQRISLARVCYSSVGVDPKKQLILLDDPLSAVDAHVGNALVENVLNSKTGLLKDTTRILVTNQLQVLKTGNVDQILLIKDGKIELKCTYDEFLEYEEKGKLTKFGISLKQNESSGDEATKKEESKKQEVKKEDNQFNPNRKLVETEKLETQQVGLKNYLAYIKNAGITTFSIYFFAYIVEHAFTLKANVFLSEWTQTKLNSSSIDEIYEYNKVQLGYYSLFSLFQFLANLFVNIFLVICSVRTSITFHKQLVYSVLRCPMSFFDTTPIGRIINRFAKDIDVVDSNLPISVKYYISCFLKIASSFVIIVYTLPVIIIPLVFIIVFYYFVQKLFVTTSRQIKRLESISRSPILTHFSESLTGVSTIRAYSAVERFTKESNAKLDLNNKSWWLSICGNRWLAIRLDFTGTLVVFLTAALVVYKKESLDGGHVGLVVSYSMLITTLFTWAVRNVTNLETDLVSIERINEYCNNKEEPLEKDFKPPKTWPEKGVIEFKNYSTRYRKDMNLVLKNLNVKFYSLDKVGVVGRTGAGKSTITLALFRLIEPVNGVILVDGIDITKLGLHTLRSRFSIIPQDPVLFSGSIRFNLDPFDRYDDQEIWKSLESAHLKEFVNSLEKGLQHQIAEGGENLSVGQRQLICLARALLKKSKILVLDEATASVDCATDELIQKTIRKEFKDCTTITIAHRINTILDSTKILVLDKGENIEFDTPELLLNDMNSQFYFLAKRANAI